MGNIEYTIISGEPPFSAELIPSLIPINIHISGGTYGFIDVPNGSYTLVINDSNGCMFEKELTIDPFVTTTTTTIPTANSIIVGQVQDETLIFNNIATNRNSKYDGYPDENIVVLYLWLKTYNGAPLTAQKIINYSIYGTSGNSFSIATLSDQMNAEVIQSVSGPAEMINGQLVLKVGFIETYLQYIYVKDIYIPTLTIELNSNKNWLYDQLQITGATNQYGVSYIDSDNVIMKF